MQVAMVTFSLLGGFAGTALEAQGAPTPFASQYAIGCASLCTLTVLIGQYHVATGTAKETRIASLLRFDFTLTGQHRRPKSV